MKEQEQKYNKGIKSTMIDVCAFEKFGVLIRAQPLSINGAQYGALGV